jgi:hypothetical protein
MKNWIKFSLTSLFMATMLFAFAQEEGTQDDRDLQYFRRPGKAGLNVFETPKDNTVEWNGVVTRIGGDFSMVFQGMDHENTSGLQSGITTANPAGVPLSNLSNNFQLPAANLNFDVQLEDGLRLHMRSYLSSRHHTEAYVKGGYIQMDKLDFISPGLLSGFMEKATIRVGMDQFNYGDAHFRRSDNAMAIYNPFVGNYIMDAFSTEPFMELTYQSNGFLGVAGITNGRLNQSPTSGDNGFAYFAKFGYDKQLNDGLRVRLTGSIYNSSDQGTRDYLYNGDRAGARYQVLAGDFSGRFNTGFAYQRSIQINPFVKAGGFEFFGIYEINNNGDKDAGGGYNQMGAEALYRVGANERLYFGGRYNKVSGEASDAADTREITRTNFGLGWFMTSNVLTKFELVNQKYEGAGWTGNVALEGASFNGFNIEAVISF